VQQPVRRSAPLTLEQVHFSYGCTHAVRNITLAAEPGELVVLVGPSGCGKSTLLRLVAGLEVPDAGQVRIDGVDVRFLPPERRCVGWVPQSYALFDHLSVAENIAFGPRMAGASRAARIAVVAELLELCRISELANRSVRALSGGQRQRVALARALAVRPRVLLLDEPLAALDPQLRAELRSRLAELVRASGVTTLLVTHDQAEALALADRIAVLHEGQVVQFDTPQRLWEQPQSAFVARFLSGATIVAGRRVEGGLIEIAPGLRLSPTVEPPPTLVVSVALRPGDLRWGTGGARARVVRSEYLGGRYQLTIAVDGVVPLLCEADHPVPPGTSGEVGPRVGARATLVMP